ncbi:MAG TPA: Qat anti-phage system associated protein QatB [Vicinamibacterales bacterium]|nr:Qat anti-phage system associated protein QatB [Vicinamibacterales bacterium]
MGTSGRSDGPNPGTPLVPSWLDDGPAGPPPAAPPELPPDAPPPQVPQIPQPPSSPPRPLPPMPPPPPPDRFRGARSNFSRFASSGGTDGRSLRRAARDYVRSGTGGSRNATRRMGASRRAANGVLGVLRDFQRDGVNATLRRLNLGDLVGRPLEEIFTGLTDVVCGDGGSIDEGIALDAWLETVADLEDFNVTDPAALTPDQMRDIFIAFISHTIEGRLLQDIGTNGLKVAADLAAIEAFERQLRDYIRRSARDSFASDISTPASLTDTQIHQIVDRTYQDAWELLMTWGDATG